MTARASDSMFLFIDFVRVTNCFYDYDYDYERRTVRFVHVIYAAAIYRLFFRFTRVVDQGVTKYRTGHSTPSHG